jgi:hypothetical protein
MPLGPLTELWAAFGKEATSREALLAASAAFAALADEREALQNLNWLAPTWPHSFQHKKSAAYDPASFSLFVTQEAVIEALSRAATHWFEAARALAVFVKNSTFAGGQNQRDYRAVAQRDQDQLSVPLSNMLAQKLPQAFPLVSGEQVFPMHCAFRIAPNHQVGAEASALTVTATETCTGIAYNSEQLRQRATALFTQQTSPGAQYQLLGEVQVGVVSATPLTISCRGLWVYTLSQDYEQFLAEQIAGHTPYKRVSISSRQDGSPAPQYQNHYL